MQNSDSKLTPDQLQERFLRSLEEYYRDSYPKVMKKKVKEILPKTKARLGPLYDVLIRDEKAWMRTVKVPDVAAVEKAMYEVRESYPELDHHKVIDYDSMQITDDAGFDPGPIFDKLREKMRMRMQGVKGE